MWPLFGGTRREPCSYTFAVVMELPIGPNRSQLAAFGFCVPSCIGLYLPVRIPLSFFLSSTCTCRGRNVSMQPRTRPWHGAESGTLGCLPFQPPTTSPWSISPCMWHYYCCRNVYLTNAAIRPANVLSRTLSLPSEFVSTPEGRKVE